MPVKLNPDEHRTWLDRQVTNPAGLVHLFQPHPADLMEMWPVSPQVNNVRNDSADLVMPVGDTPPLNLDIETRRKIDFGKKEATAFPQWLLSVSPVYVQTG